MLISKLQANVSNKVKTNAKEKRKKILKAVPVNNILKELCM